MRVAERRTEGRAGRSARTASVLFVAVFASVAFLTVVVRAPPPIPMVVHGRALDIGGAPLARGTPVRAFLDGVQYSNDSIVLDSAGTYWIAIAGDWILNGAIETPTLKEGPNPGETVLFAAGDFTIATPVFQETVAWQADRILMQDLHLALAAVTPSPVKIQAIVVEPASGDSPYAFLCNPGSAAVPLADYYLQTDVPGSYQGPVTPLSGSLAPGTVDRVNLTPSGFLQPGGDALKLVYRNRGGASAPAGGGDIAVDRLEYNATVNGTLAWQPGNTILGSAPAPGPGRILERTAACTDTNTPSDFAVAFEPGVPTDSVPTVRINSPAAGAFIPGGASFTFAWTMSDPAFASAYLRVWANVSCGSATSSLLSGTRGATSASWSVPNAAASGCVVHLDVLNPYGGAGAATTTFSVRSSEPWAIVIAALIVAVVLIFMLLAWRSSRHKRPPAAPETPGPAPAPPPTAPAPAEAAPPNGGKICPRCHTVVKAEDETCFFCGYAFLPPT